MNNVGNYLKLWLGGACLGLLAVFAWSPLVTQAADSEKISVFVDCIYPEADGTLTAYFGYENNNSSSVMISHGPDNKVTPAGYDGVQPTDFELPGVVPGRSGRTAFYGTPAFFPDGFAFAVNYPTSDSIVWSLKGPDGSTRTTTAGGTPPDNMLCEPICGDGRVNDGEECDDQNMEDGDGCSAECKIEYEPVKPILECVYHEDDGSYTAYFGYENMNDTGVTIPHGPENKVSPSEYDGVQPEEFPLPNEIDGRPGRTPWYPGHAFSVNFDDGNVVWTLEGPDGSSRTATASDNPAQECDRFCGDGRVNVEGEQCDDGNTEDGDGCSANCQDEVAKVIAHKIVCDDESYLPNRGDGGDEIDADSAQEYVDASNGHCWFARDWEFERGGNNASAPDGDYYGAAGNGWTTFGPTDGDGMAMALIDVAGLSRIKMREVLKWGYLPFSDDNDDAYSAEIYCHTDVGNYDNEEWINNPEVGATYHCVAFNTPEAELKVNKWLCPRDIEVTNDLRPDENGESEVDPASLGCLPAEGYGFGHDEDNTTSPNGPTYLPQNFHEFGSTDENGMLLVPIHAGEYLVGETYNNERVPHEDVLGVLCDSSPSQGVRTNNLEAITVEQGERAYCNVLNPMPSAKLIAHKIVCTDEAALPNRGDGGEHIDADSAEEYVAASNGRCRFAPEWNFERTYESSSTPVGDYYGPAGGEWTLFGPTDSDGMAMTYVPLLDGTKRIDVREVLQQGYLPFSDDGDYSAEIYCHQDVTNYDNRDRVEHPEDEEVYYCVAFNTREFGECDGNVYATLSYDDMHAQFDIEDGYDDGTVRVTSLGNGKVELSVLGGESAEGTLTFMNAVLDGDVTGDYSFGHKLEVDDGFHDDQVAGSDGTTTVAFDFATRPNAQWRDDQLIMIHTAPACRGSIQGRKYRDVNANGNFDKPEKQVPGNVNRLNGWHISLYTTDRELVDRMETGDDDTAAGNVGKGQYKFVDLEPGTYYMCEEDRPGWNQYEPDSGETDPDTGWYCHTVEVGIQEDVKGIQFGNREEICREPVTEYADEVVSYNQGSAKDGPVGANRSDPDHVLGAPDATTNPVDGFFSLGFGGTITVWFDSPVYDLEGDDLSFHEVTNGRDSYPEETIQVEVSQDGTNWIVAGTVSSSDGPVTYLDLDGLGLFWIQYVRVTDTSDAQIHDSRADGYDLDSIDAVYTCPEYEENGGEENGGEENGGEENGGEENGEEENGEEENGEEEPQPVTTRKSGGGGTQTPPSPPATPPSGDNEAGEGDGSTDGGELLDTGGDGDGDGDLDIKGIIQGNQLAPGKAAVELPQFLLDTGVEQPTSSSSHSLIELIALILGLSTVVLFGVTIIKE